MIWLYLLGLPLASQYLKNTTFRGDCSRFSRYFRRLHRLAQCGQNDCEGWSGGKKQLWWLQENSQQRRPSRIDCRGKDSSPANQTSVSEQRNIMPKAKSILPPSNSTSVVQAIILVGKYRMQLPDGSVAKVKYLRKRAVNLNELHLKEITFW